MVGGPVCHFELVRLSRQRRFFALRFLTGLVLLAIVGANYLTVSDPFWYWNGQPARRMVSIHEMARFSRGLFASMIAVQAALVFALTPSLVADAIASERHRKTLHYLLVSRLTGGEIVAGKLLARMLNVGVFAFLVLPVLSILTLIGGVDPEELLWCYASLISSAFFMAGMAIFASVIARRPRDAVGLSYALTAVWLFLVPTLWGVLSWFPETRQRVTGPLEWVDRWAWPASPLSLLADAAAISKGGRASLRSEVAWMVGSETAYGFVFCALAVWQLRPAFRRNEGRAGRRVRSGPWDRLRLPRRACGTDPVYWKEAYFSRTRGGIFRRLARLSVPILLIMVVGFTVYGSRDAFRELGTHGYGFADFSGYSERMELNVALRILGSLVYAVWMLWLAGLTGASIATEREQDTWISLLATPLDGTEILRGKMFGALRATAPFGATLGALWLIGLAAGAIHPMGFLFVVAGLALSIWYVTALGMSFSLNSNTSWRAQAAAIGVLIAPHMCCIIPSPLMFMAYSLLSYWDFKELMDLPSTMNESRMLLLFAAYIAFGLTLYTGAALGMTRGLFRRFDSVAGRPMRLVGRSPAAARPNGPLTGGPSGSVPVEPFDSVRD